ncbi:hypothetical protein ABZS77_10505 [Micromonospora sp. NPDC005298]|uniref:hypothetical protein n=1 Tax=Micromonospora sp. NPDC005298 TaxID=3156873 RepID=UPI0033AFB0C7
MGKPDAEGHGPSDGLPDLPPEWGRVVIPDDASALAGEAAQVRRELRRAAGARSPYRALALPMLVLLVALLTTLAGLLAVTWPRATRGADRPAPTPSSPPVALTGRALPALDLVDSGQAPVPLRGLLPAMIILVDGCPCPAVVTEAAATAPAGVTVITVTGGRTVAPPPVHGIQALADPAGGLRSFLGQPAHPGTATALLVDRAGVVTRVLPELGPIDAYRDDLSALAA